MLWPERILGGLNYPLKVRIPVDEDEESLKSLLLLEPHLPIRVVTNVGENRMELENTGLQSSEEKGRMRMSG